MTDVFLSNHQKSFRILAYVFLGFSLFFGVQSSANEEKKNEKQAFADVVSVKVTGKSEAYQFSVGIKSPDTGCDQYADWWEVLSEDGKLLYRRILLHSHVDEQPFTRSGGPVAIQQNTIVWVRAHMNTTGYGGKVFQGSVQNGFQETECDPDFAIDVANALPQPDGCAF